MKVAACRWTVLEKVQACCRHGRLLGRREEQAGCVHGGLGVSWVVQVLHEGWQWLGSMGGGDMGLQEIGLGPFWAGPCGLLRYVGYMHGVRGSSL